MTRVTLCSARSGSTAMSYRNCYHLGWAADEDRVSHVLSHVV